MPTTTPSRTSFTAFAVIASLEKLALMPRFAPEMEPDWQRLNALLLDGATDSRLRRAVRRLSPGPAQWLLDRLFVPGMMRHYLLRKLFIRREVERAIAEGATQVVVLGGGFDTLAWRLATANPAVQFLELDLPSTQATKRALLEGAGLPPANCQFFPADLASATLGDTLRSAPGFDASARTIVVIEGVLMYLRAPAVEALFGALGSVLPTQHSVVFGATVASDDAGALPLRMVNALLRRGHEGTAWHCPSRDIPAFLHALGYRLDAWLPYQTLQADFVDEATLAKLPAEDENYYRAVRASRVDEEAAPGIDSIPFAKLS